jgi:hypothetical protein
MANGKGPSVRHQQLAIPLHTSLAFVAALRFCAVILDVAQAVSKLCSPNINLKN